MFTWFTSLDVQIQSALISATVTVIVLFITYILRSFWEKHFHLFKLESEHIYEQRKQIKQILSKNKIHLLNASDAFNHRLWNFSVNYQEKWHCLENYQNVEQENYFISFVYRFTAFFAWIRKLGKEMVFLDTTIASDKDLILIKYLQVFQQIMCDVQLLEGLDYDKNFATDHFFNNNFEEMSELLIDNDDIISFSRFKENIDDYKNKLLPIFDFINAISPNEHRYRWDKIKILHLTILSFLNTYGYDYQHTKKSKFITALSNFSNEIIITNFKILLEKYHLDSQKDFKQSLKKY